MSRKSEDAGFTLVELLVVIIILGVLAAIAIPSFMNQREKAWRKAAVSDLRNAAVVMETYFDETGTYLPVGALTPGLTEPFTFRTSGGSEGDVEVFLPVAGMTTATEYCLEADHIKIAGTGTADYHLDSHEGRPAPGPC
jgi:type IV pilus assembly protein PilA